MYAIVKQRREPKAELTTVDEPKIGANEVLVEVKMASICGTDVHIWEYNKWAQNRLQKIPFIFGHEVAGKVIEIGSDVTSIQVGDMVSAETHIADNTCYQCKTDRKHICQNMEILGVDRDGVFAEYVALPAENAWVNDPALPLAVASVQEPLGNAVQTALPRNNVEDIAGKTVAVLGCGPIGLFSIAVAKKLGAAHVFAIAGGTNKVRMNLAQTMGADMTLSAREEGENVVKTIIDATDGIGVDVVFEMSGAATALPQVFDMLTPGGRVGLLGIFSHPFTFDANKMVFTAATIFGISGRRMWQTWYQVKAFLADSTFREKIEAVITHQIPIRDIAKGFELIEAKQAAKVALEPKWE
ncbi:MAG: L-threonine 3-dehydrogenase [Candidatus Heimdallarchaeota archaeon]